MLFQKKALYVLLDIAIILLIGILLFYGSSRQFSDKYVDAAIYQCYAVAFWQGASGLHALSSGQCAFLNNKDLLNIVIQSLTNHHIPHWIVQLAIRQEAGVRFHTLPREYPVLTLIPFSLALLAPMQFYQQAFAILTIVFAAVLYFLFKRFASTRSALIFVAYLVIAGWSTAASRFDIFPAGLTLGALIMADQKRWNWAFTFLALGALFKFYPAILVVPLFIAQQQSEDGSWFAWHRWRGLATFLITCAAIVLVSMALSISGTLGALRYFTARPLEIETLSAAFVWLGGFVGHPYHYDFSFVSLNVASDLSSKISSLGTLLLVLLLLCTFGLQIWRKLNVALTSLVTITVVLVTGKVFSPQYVIWVIPLAVYAGKPNWRWCVPWGAVMVLTLLIYPVVYTYSAPPPTIIFFLALLRGLILLGMVLALLGSSAFRARAVEVIEVA